MKATDNKNNKATPLKSIHEHTLTVGKYLISPLVKALENGWYAGWWPANKPPGLDRNPDQGVDAVVRGYDAAGALLDEVRP